MWRAGVDVKSAGAADDDDDWETDADFVVWILLFYQLYYFLFV